MKDYAAYPHHLLRCCVLKKPLQSLRFGLLRVVFDELVKTVVDIAQLEVKPAGVIRQLATARCKEFLQGSHG